MNTSNLVIVAIPSKDDYVWKISSEKVPHLTLLFLGEHDFGPQTQRVVEFVEHVTDTSLREFSLEVDRRGELGDDKADVLFFGKYNIKKLENFRSYLLNDNDISKGYNSTTQYPLWTPHLTLGYSATPAKPDDREYPGISWVKFDRIAVWNDDFEGSEFELKSNQDLEMGMKSAEDVLAHFGVAGMRWGVRNARSSGGLSISKDAAEAKIIRGKVQKPKKGGTNALTNPELQQLVNRMNLEQQYSRLSTQSKRVSPGKKFAANIVKDEAQTYFLRGKPGPLVTIIGGALGAKSGKHRK